MKKMRRRHKKQRQDILVRAGKDKFTTEQKIDFETLHALATSEPAPEEKTPDTSFNAWLEEMPPGKLLIWALLCYGAGVSLYSAFGMMAGYSFWQTCAIFAGTAFTGIITHLCADIYVVYANRNRIFDSYRSWFMRFDDFLNEEFVQFEDRLTARTKTWECEDIYAKVIAIILFLPVFGLAIGIVAALQVFILALDWVRLFAIGCANLCLFLIPYHLAVGFTVGAMVGAALSLSLDRNILFSFYAFWVVIGGIVGVYASLYKELRKRKYGTPYFPT